MNVRDIIKSVSLSKTAKACGVSCPAVFRWCKNNRLPYTDYIGTTFYHKDIIILAKENGLEVKKEDLLVVKSK